ncbi:MAG: iron-siderophore ABC transporter substrate-binding protein [Limnothrix sp. RL_2_0]|nr:iron-siderophore ABC transporter substrate-binding protein [Limnothrix sp. RL_2_0]
MSNGDGICRNHVSYPILHLHLDAFTLKVWQGVLSLLICLIVVACGGRSPQVSPEATSSAGAKDCRMIVHELGESEVCGQPEKVVALSLHSLDLMLSLEQQPAGLVSLVPTTEKMIENPSELFPYVGDLITTQPVNLGGAMSAPSLEVMTELKPDLIITESGNVKDVYDLLSQLAPTIALKNRSQPGNWQDNLRMVALGLGDESRADQKIAEVEAAIATLKTDLAAQVAEHPKLLILAGENLDQGFGVITADSFLGEILTELGFELIAPEGTTNSVAISIEALPELDGADSILVLGYSREAITGSQESSDPDNLIQDQFAGIKQIWADNDIAQSLSATQADRVYFSTYYEWNIFNGPIGVDLIDQQLRQLFLGVEL